jgi:hypothetical protein
VQRVRFPEQICMVHQGCRRHCRILEKNCSEKTDGLLDISTHQSKPPQAGGAKRQLVEACIQGRCM